MSLHPATVAPSTNQISSQNAGRLDAPQTQTKHRWWNSWRIEERLSIAVGFCLRSCFFVLIGALCALLFVTRYPFRAEAVRPSGIASDIVPGKTPGVQFLSESTPLFDVISADTLVRVCFHGMDLDVGTQTVMVDHQTFTVRQMSDALKVIAALEPPSSRQQPCFAPAPILTDGDVDTSPVWVEVDRGPPGVDVERASISDSSPE